MTLFPSGFAQDYYERWGFNDPKVRSRVWARVPEIILQEVTVWPLYAVITGIGAHCLAASTVSILGDLFLFNSPAIYYCLWWPLTSCVGLIVTALVAKSRGGKFWQIPVGITTLCQSVVFGGNIARLYYADELPIVGKDKDDTLTLCVALGVMYFMLSPLSVVWVESIEQYRLTSNRTLTESEFSNIASPRSSRSGRFSRLAFVLLVLAETVRAYSSLPQFPEIGTTALKDALNIIVLALSVITAVNSVNASLVAGDYAWYWRAFASAAIPVAMIQVATVVAAALISGTGGHAFRLWTALLRISEIGAAGSLGAYFALWKAQAHVYNEQELKEIYQRLVIPRPKKVEGADEAQSD